MTTTHTPIRHTDSEGTMWELSEYTIRRSGEIRTVRRWRKVGGK